MAFTPDPNLFANSLGAGMRVGSGFADLFRQRRQEGELRRIAQMAASGNPDYNQIGAGLIGAGQVGAGVNALGVPYQRAQDSLNQEMRRRVLENQITQQNRPSVPTGYMAVDPNDPTKGVTQLPGYDPKRNTVETWQAPVRVIGEDGKPALARFSNLGNMEFVEGVQPGVTLQKSDAGTHWVYTDALTGEEVKREPKNNFTAEQDKAQGAASGKLTVEKAGQAYEQLGKIETGLANINDAIAAIDSGANSGVIYNKLPSLSLASASLENAMNRLGLDVVGSVTFGALSEGEMRLAMETAVPRNLNPQELRKWLVTKRDAQMKARDALQQAAEYLSTPGNSINSWMRDKQTQLPPDQRRTLADAGTPGVVQPVPQGGARQTSNGVTWSLD